MQLQFESNLEYQQQAINSVLNIFEGQPSQELIDYDLYGSNISNIIAVSNNLILDQSQILNNIQSIQGKHGLTVSNTLDGMNFSIEMETGTGKTYVYLRTIHELNKKYGWTKFVIVVPSIAILEGVNTNLRVTFQHFRELYNTNVDYQIYNGGKVSHLRTFANSNIIQILVINIDSFVKDDNIINKPNDKLSGHKPIDFIRATNPVVIVDEPQNMETEKRRNGIAELNPLCTLRYSATHKYAYNLIYSLNPVRAYELGLVKQIEVYSVVEEDSLNHAYIDLISLKATKTTMSATIKINYIGANEVIRKQLTVKIDDNLYNKSNYNPLYDNGYIINAINKSEGYIELSNGQIIYQGQTQEINRDDVMKEQIKRTIESHLDKELKLKQKGEAIKVLSLFFIDRVANYRSYDESGNIINGKIHQWFEELYSELKDKPRYKNIFNNSEDISKIHNGYFSSDKKGKLKDTNGSTKDDNDTYNLIMKDKEELLKLDNPLRFIFSHSALREGWDNPNVFQICTLNETTSETKKRQEIGRGLRLCVRDDGSRVYDNNINRLTVIPNESYESFAKSLQTEIEEDCGVKFNKPIANAKERIVITYRKELHLDENFKEIWDRIKYKTSYRVNYSTKDLIDQTSKVINTELHITKPRINYSKGLLKITNTGIGVDNLGGGYSSNLLNSYTKIPNILNYIQSKTGLTRDTISRILKQSGKLSDLRINPQLFQDEVSRIINKVLQKFLIDGIKYYNLNNEVYEMSLFSSDELKNELEAYLSDTFEVTQTDKTISDYIVYDSNPEYQFATECETNENIKFYFKLPSWFKIPTPIGSYNPDWAIMFINHDNEERLYFVAETKNTKTNRGVDTSLLYGSEQYKIYCGQEHYNNAIDRNGAKLFNEVKYEVVQNVTELENIVFEINKENK